MFVRIATLGVLAAAVACHRRPDFDVDKAQIELAHAFDKTTREVSIYEDGRGDQEDEWIIEFRLEGVEPFMQARFKGVKDRWELQDVRERPSGGQETPWESVGVLLGRMRGAAADHAHESLDRMKELADFIGTNAVHNGNRFPQADMDGLHRMLINDGTVQDKDWHHDTDGWGQRLIYHAAPDGLAYILISPGADGKLDRPSEEYYAKTDQGDEAYGGRSTNPNADIIIASGGVVQYYEP
jgi:hypothetical protein